MQAEAGASLTEATDGATGRPAASPRYLVTLALCAVVAYAADQAIKAWVVSALQPEEPRDLLGSFLRLRRVSNPGAAFSFATNATWVLTVIAAAVVVAVLVTARRLRSFGWAVAFGLLVGGALGNLTDRFVRAPGGGRGEVVDFLQLPHWPIFNIADCAICTSAALIVVLSMRGIGLDGVVQRDDAKKASTTSQEKDRT